MMANTHRSVQSASLARQSGLTLMEFLVAAVVSIMTVFAMVVVMASSLGSSTRTIQMTRLSQEMRTGLSVLTRELRRANYHAGFLACFGNAGCRTTLGITGQIKPINMSLDNTTVAGGDDCLWFYYQRPDLTLANSFLAGFRIDQDAGEGRTLQMTTLATAEPGDCNNDNGWVDITDPEIIDVETFSVVNTGYDFNRDGDYVDATDYAGCAIDTFNDGADSQRAERIEITLTASLIDDGTVLPDWMTPGTTNVTTRQMRHFVNVRNNLTAAGAVLDCT